MTNLFEKRLKIINGPHKKIFLVLAFSSVLTGTITYKVLGETLGSDWIKSTDGSGSSSTTCESCGNAGEPLQAGGGFSSRPTVGNRPCTSFSQSSGGGSSSNSSRPFVINPNLFRRPSTQADGTLPRETIRSAVLRNSGASCGPSSRPIMAGSRPFVINPELNLSFQSSFNRPVQFGFGRGVWPKEPVGVPGEGDELVLALGGNIGASFPSTGGRPFQANLAGFRMNVLGNDSIEIVNANGSSQKLVKSGSLFLLTEETDMQGNKITYTRLEDGRLSKITDQYGVERYSVEYGPNGLAQTVTENGIQTSLSYDDKERLIKVTHPDGKSDQLTYLDSSDQYAAEAGFTSEYDSIGVIRVDKPAQGGEIINTFERDLSPLQVFSKDSWVNFSYDENSITTTNYDGSSQTLKLLSDNEIELSQKPAGLTESFTTKRIAFKDTDNSVIRHIGRPLVQVSSITQSTGADTSSCPSGTAGLGQVTTLFEYNRQRPTVIRNIGGGRTLGEMRYEYDEESGMPIRQTTVLESGKSLSSSTSYTTIGKARVVASSTDEYGNQTTYTYDQSARPIRLAYNGKTQAEYEYDGKGNVTRETSYVGTTPFSTTYAYDNTGLLSTVTDDQGNTVNYTRNALGQVTSTKKNGVEVASREYDRLGRPESATAPSKDLNGKPFVLGTQIQNSQWTQDNGYLKQQSLIKSTINGFDLGGTQVSWDLSKTCPSCQQQVEEIQQTQCTFTPSVKESTGSSNTQTCSQIGNSEEYSKYGFPAVHDGNASKCPASAPNCPSLTDWCATKPAGAGATLYGVNTPPTGTPVACGCNKN